MTNKEITPKSGASLPQGWQASSSDEVDLRDLVLVLWQQKLLILIITVLFAVVGVGYALLASEQWSTKAVITAPKPEDLLPMRKVAMQAEALGLKGFPREGANKSLI
ncbi:Wzz/FepE/Etk N-terminal domain-containing protein [Aeromonas caviae]